MSRLLSLSVLLAGACLGAIPVHPQMKSFGHSIKNGHFFPKGNEITTFEHTCGTPPCAITQLHCPTAGPVGWQDARVRIYIDGEAMASIDITLLELVNVGVYNGQEGDAEPWGNDLFGHTANKGGVYSTMRIPFGKSVKTTIESAQADRSGTFWFIVRGVEAYPVILGDLQLPAAARLKLHRFDNFTVPKQLVTLADIPAGTAGALLSLKLDAAGTGSQLGLQYLEACFRAEIDGAASPLFLSSGAEDYFLSAYYFNEGVFKTGQAGLTYKDNKAGKMSAYKNHDRDPILFNDGLRLVFRNSEVTAGCGSMEQAPNQWCPPNASAVDFSAYAAQAAADKGCARLGSSPGALTGTGSTATPASVDYGQFFLGKQGQNCDEACHDVAAGQFCNASMDFGDADRGEAMMVHLNISGCFKNATAPGKAHDPLEWWQYDQPNYVSAAVNPETKKPEPNYRECLGFVGVRLFACVCLSCWQVNQCL
jgi:hypothetical protein